jgi:type I restriction enzyme S subunit
MKPGYKQTEVGVIPEEWEVKNLGEIATIATGSTPPTSDASNYGDEYLFVGPVDMGENKFISRTEKKLSRKGFAISRRFPKHSILFVSIGSTIGKCGVAPVELTSNQQINAIFPSPAFSVDFLFYAVSCAAPRIKSQAGEQAVPIVNKSQFSETLVALPPLSEQRAIATALSDVDALLAALDRLIAKKRDLKQAAMQQFLTGQTRLPGFDGEWEVKRLGDVASVSKGTQLHSSETDEGGRFAHLNGGITPSGYTHKSNTAGNTIAISEGGNSCGFVQFMTDPYWCGGHCYSVISNGLDNHFLYHALKGQQSNIMGLRVGSGLPNVQKTSLLAFKLAIPQSLPEQTAIAAVLSDMDAELAALEQRRDKTRALKQGMMQEVLTGKTRLV